MQYMQDAIDTLAEKKTCMCIFWAGSERYLPVFK